MNARALAEAGWPCPTGAEMREIDRVAIESCGSSSRLLMENAGRAVALAVRQQYSGARRPLVVCGAGNNGGDGFVIARVLRDWDDRIHPAVAVLGDRARYSPEARENLELLMSSGAEVIFPEGEKDLLTVVRSADLVIDALFGLGLSRPVEGFPAEVLRMLAGQAREVVAVDLPSGSSADTGAPMGVELPTSVVVTLGLPKLGLAVRPLAATVLVADIGLPWGAVEAVSVRQRVWTAQAARSRLPARPAGGHKGSFGHVLVVAGSEGKTGAACLAADGALRAGAGLVTVAAPRALHDSFEAKLKEAMSHPLEDAGSAALIPAAVEALLREAATRDALVVGPGLGRSPGTVEALERLLSSARTPAVVDADGLNAFGGRPEALRGPGPRMLTPHPGEMARLLSRETGEVQRDRVAAARELAARSGAVVVLKGARTVTAAPDGEVRVNPTGGPGLATGGTGDVLAGAAGALLAAGLSPFEAGALAAYLHGLAAEPLGSVGVLAGEVARELPAAWRRLAETPEAAHERDLLRRFP